MIRSSLNAIRKLIDDVTTGDDEVQELYNEVVLMTLSRATSVDSNINIAEISNVKSTIQELTGEEVSDSDIRVAAKSKLYESGTLSRYLNTVSSRLSPEKKVDLINALATVIKSDEKVTEREVFFLNLVADDLNIHASDLIGLQQTQSF